MILLVLLSLFVLVAFLDILFVWQTITKLAGLCDNYRHMMVNLKSELKRKDKEFQDIYKSKESTREALAMADRKHLDA